MKMFFTKARIFVTVLGYALRMQRTSLKPSSIDLTGWTTSDLFSGDSPQPPAVYVSCWTHFATASTVSTSTQITIVSRCTA